ncbi:hypothetical protein UPYG_G00194330 [Umbra pygmaea]|uniref:Neuromodulin n=1 Tax=Umbra pygmaea TaxID=75934 RepID=A0ABD0WM54_UMBPY
MLCCIRRTKPVEKNEDADQEIKQDEKKPEDKAHKAATKIQASFRGHIIRKKMKDGEEEEEASPAVPEEDGKEAAEGEEEKKGDAPAATEQSAEEDAPAKQKEAESNQAKSPVSEKPANSPASVATTPVATANSPSAALPQRWHHPQSPPKWRPVQSPAMPQRSHKRWNATRRPTAPPPIVLRRRVWKAPLIRRRPNKPMCLLLLSVTPLIRRSQTKHRTTTMLPKNLIQMRRPMQKQTRSLRTTRRKFNIENII